MTDDTRDRVIRLEANVAEITRNVADIRNEIRIKSGPKWVIVGVPASIMGFLSGWFSKGGN